MKISCLMLLFFSLPVSAANLCSQTKSFKEVDLRSDMGPLRNQGGLGWCYGFTAADLMTHYRLKKNQISSVTPDTMVSAVGVSAKYNKQFFREYGPEKELLKRQLESEKKEEQEKAAKEDAIKEKRNRINYPNLYKARDKILSLNPFSKDQKAQEKRPATPKTGPEPAPKPKALQKGDLIPWDNVSKDREYASRNIVKNLLETGNLADAFAMRTRSISNMSAAEYQKLEIKVVPSSGYIFAAIDSAKNSFCIESEARSGDVTIERFNLKQLLDTIFDTARNKKTITCASLLSIHQMVPALDLKRIVEVLTYSNYASAYEVLINNSCKRKLSDDPDEPEVLGWTLPVDYINKETMITEAQIELLNRIDKVLDVGTPVGINYYSDFLTKPNGESKLPHASSLVGKRMNPDTCEEEYILRNSYGEGCAYYKKFNNDYAACIAQANTEKNDKQKNRKKSECDHKNVPLFLNPKVSCDEGSGYLFVNKKELGKHLFGMTYLKE